MEQSAPESNCGVGGLTTWLASGERELPDRSPMQKQQRTRARGTADVEARTRGMLQAQRRGCVQRRVQSARNSRWLSQIELES
jgi:hypothetical protein